MDCHFESFDKQVLEHRLDLVRCRSNRHSGIYLVVLACHPVWTHELHVFQRESDEKNGFQRDAIVVQPAGLPAAGFPIGAAPMRIAPFGNLPDVLFTVATSPFSFLVVSMAGWLNQKQKQVIDYLLE